MEKPLDYKLYQGLLDLALSIHLLYLFLLTPVIGKLEAQINLAWDFSWFFSVGREDLSDREACVPAFSSSKSSTGLAFILLFPPLPEN
jgi:hypothetical protein